MTIAKDKWSFVENCQSFIAHVEKTDEEEKGEGEGEGEGGGEGEKEKEIDNISLYHQYLPVITQRIRDKMIAGVWKGKF